MYASPLSHTARDRLKVIFGTTDGFEIAQQDLLQRGPGEFLGERQSGDALLRYADLEADKDLVETAQQVAAELLDKAPQVAQRHVARWLASRHELLRA
jgi:ATP-dependent DNA helicase RecG